MLPTVAQVLEMDAVRAGEPRVVVGEEWLGRPVRWVHAIELPDAARLLRGGELVLTTGIALPDEEALLGAYVSDLADVGVSAVAVELGRKYINGLPDRFAAAAAEFELPLIVFDHEIPFIAITEAVHGRIIDEQLDELRGAARLHEVFTDLAVAGAGPDEVLRQVALLSGRPVILADLSHHVLACEAAGADPARVLEGFEERSRAMTRPARTWYDPGTGWLVTTVGARGEDWDILGFNVQSAGTRSALFAISVVTLGLAFYICRAIVASKLGKVLIAIRDAENRVRFLGYRVESYKLFVFTLSACMAGIAGALYVPQVGIINPSEFAPGNSIEAVIWVAVGGRGTLIGAVLGAILVNYAKTSFTSGSLAPYWLFVLGGLFIAVTLLLPRGIVGTVESWWKGRGPKTRGNGVAPAGVADPHPAE